jgi:hypothetical protein
MTSHLFQTGSKYLIAVEEFRNLERVSFTGLTDEEPCELQVGEALFEKYSAMWTNQGTLMSDTFFKALRPFLDGNYFHFRQLRFGKS